MRRLLTIAVVLVALGVEAQPSYWFQGFQRQGNAQYAQQYFATNGVGITFSFDGVHWVISATGTNIASATNAIYAQTATNWLGSNAMWLSLSNQIVAATNNLHFTTTGLSVTQNWLAWTLLATNQWTNVFSNGLLIVSGPFVPTHGASLLLEGGGYILLEGGGTILKE